MRMRTKDETRQAGNAITLAVALLAVYCLLAGDEWAAGTLALAAAVLAVAVEMRRKMITRRL